jgi:release factor glutamine methyltransferase
MSEQRSASSNFCRDLLIDLHRRPGWERDEWRTEIFSIYAKMRARSRQGPYEMQCGDISLIVMPGVYAPRFFTDSLWFASQLPAIVGKESLLEIGTGTGVIAIACARRGSSVVATDINGDAVNNAKLNVARSGLSMDIYGGNVYSGIPVGRLFDYIFWSHPFNNCDAPVHDPLLMSGMDHGYSALKEYFHSAGSHLSPIGRVLLGTGDSADLGTVFEIADQYGYARNLLRSATMPLQEDGQTLVTYFLYEFSPYLSVI